MSGETPARAFQQAMIAAQKAWHGTSLLARALQAKAQALNQVVASGQPAQVADFLWDVAGPAFAAECAAGGLDALRVQKLGHIVLEMAVREALPPGAAAPQHVTPQLVLERLERLARALMAWIDTGGAGGDGDLARTGALLGRPERRLAIVAPLASAIGVCMVVAKALATGYPLQEST